MPRLTDLSLSDLLAAFRSADPTPGGGAASALAGALGSSLLVMIAGLPRPRAATNTEVEQLQAAGMRCAALSERLTDLVDRDSDAYEQVIAAFRRPKATDEEKASRGGVIQQALRSATETPLEIMRACADAIQQAPSIARLGNRNASSDVQVALELLGAGLRGASCNVDINLDRITDADYVASARKDASRLAIKADTEIAAARAVLRGQSGTVPLTGQVL
jgi:methenyltetrahydrofolate cyclohydrolase